MLWEVVEDRVIEDPKDNDEIGLRGVDNIILTKKGGGGLREVFSEYTYLLMLMKLRTEDWENQL